MIKDLISKLVLLTLLLSSLIQGLQAQTNLAKPNEIIIKKIKSLNGLVSLWKFNEEPGMDRRASGKGEFALRESNGKVSRVNEGPLSGYSIILDGSKYLTLSHSQTGSLNIYGGKFIKSFLNGVFEARESELIRNTTGFEGYPNGLFQTKNPYYFPDGVGNNGSDFTVGSVLLKSGMGNFFKGLIGGLAVFDRALSENEIKSICYINDL